MQITFDIKKIEQIVKKQILPQLKKYKILTFTGPLGAGKTTIIKELLKQCGIEQTITSPTFTYLNVYKNNKGEIFNHFDLYRIPKIQSFIDSGFDEYLSKEFQKENSWTLIEWPEVIGPLLSEKSICKNVCNIYLNYKNDDFEQRTIEIKKK